MSAPRARIFFLLALAFLLRLAPVLTPLDWTAPDSETYEGPAHSLIAKHAYLDTQGRETAERPPTYPLFLAGVYLVHDSKRAVGVAQALLGTLTVFLLERLIRRRKPQAALPAAFLLAIDPIAIGVVPYVLREALLLFLLTLLLYILDRTTGLRQGALAGLVLAVLALTHQLYVVLGGFIIIGALLTKKPVVPLLGALALVALGIGTWTARNKAIGSNQLMLTSYPVPAGELWLVSESTNEWLHDDPTTGYQDMHFKEIARLQKEHPDDIGAVKRELYARAWANFTREPLTVLGRVLRINIWYWLEVPGSVRITLHPRLWLARLLLIPFHWIRLFWAIVAIILLRRKGELGTFSAEAAAWAFLLIAPAVLLPIPRYLAPLTAVLDGFAAIGWMLERQRSLTAPATTVNTPTP
jgi:hypothetical protein